MREEWMRMEVSGEWKTSTHYLGRWGRGGKIVAVGATDERYGACARGGGFEASYIACPNRCARAHRGHPSADARANYGIYRQSAISFFVIYIVSGKSLTAVSVKWEYER